MLIGAPTAAKGNKQIADHVTTLMFPNKLNMGEVQGRVDTYCRDTTHMDKTLVEAIEHIADDFDRP